MVYGAWQCRGSPVLLPNAVVLWSANSKPPDLGRKGGSQVLSASLA